jgi:photosystem II stability/assembly factor-like uncharacterized protein
MSNPEFCVFSNLKLICLIAILGWQHLLMGQCPALQNILPSLSSVHFTDAENGWAVGLNSDIITIINTNNGGATWSTSVAHEICNGLRSVYFTDAQTGWAVGVSGVIMHTTNGGTSWIQQTSGTTNSLTSVYFADSQNGWAVGVGIILKTTNGGANWISSFTTTEILLAVYFIDTQTGWAAGYNGIIYNTTTGGMNWTIQTSGNSGGSANKLNSIYFTDTQNGWVVGNNGTILHTNNGGGDWKLQSSGIADDFSSVYFTDAQTGWVVGGTILRTANAGSNWSVPGSGTINGLLSVFFTNNQTGWAVGLDGSIWKSTDGGNNWAAQSLLSNGNLRIPNDYLHSVYFPNSQVGWAVGDGGTIMYTSNSGATWNPQPSMIINHLYSVYFINAQTGWVVGNEGTIGNTIDGGAHWIQQTSGTTNNLSSIYFADTQNGWVVGVGGTIRHTIDGGAHWIQQTSGTTNNLSSVYFADSQNGWAVGDYGTILHTSNGGVDWAQQTPGTNYSLSSVYFIDSQIGWAVGEANTLRNTIDGGNNWIPQNLGVLNNFSFNSVFFTDAQTGWVIFDLGIRYTVDGGNTWHSYYNISSPSSLYFTNAQTGWVVGKTGEIVKFTPSVSTTINGNLSICPGDSTKLSVNGNFQSYSWSNGQISDTIIIKAAGTYTVTATDCNGCISTAHADVSIGATGPNATATGGTLNCLQNPVTISSNTTTPGATLSWTGPNGFFSTQSSVNVNVPGQYILTVTDLNGCKASAIANVNLDTVQPGAAATADSITCSNPISTLKGATNDNVNNVTWAWTGPTGFTSAQRYPITNIPGSYTLLVSGLNGCTSTATVLVIQDINIPIMTATGGELTCMNPSIQLNCDALLPVSYNWMGPGGFTSTLQNPMVSIPGVYTVVVTTSSGCTSFTTASVDQNTIIPIITLPTIDVLDCAHPCITVQPTSTADTIYPIQVCQPGTYTVQVTDPNNGCTSSSDFTVNKVPPLQATVLPWAVDCSNTATLTASPTDGTPAYHYAWSTGATTASVTVTAPATVSATVTDEGGCVANLGPITINAIPPVTVVNILANEYPSGALNGSITLNVTSGKAPFTFNWNTGQTTNPLTGLGSGTYSVTVTDANGCTATNTATLISTNGPALSATTTPSACNQSTGNVTITLTGGTPAFSYVWSNNTTTQNLNNVSAGSYTVTVTDGNGHTATAAATVLNTNGPTITASPVASNCGQTTGSITLSITGGATPYTYLWDTGQTTNPLTNTGSGTYSVTVTDNLGCTATTTSTINDTGTIPTASATGGSLDCNNPNTALTGMSNLTGVTWKWSGPGSFTSSQQNPVVNIAGTYTLQVTSPAGCTNTATASVVDNTGKPDINATGGDISCQQPTVTLHGSSTTPGVSYAWTGPNNTQFMQQNPTVDKPGNYTLVVTNPATGCSSSKTVEVTQTGIPTPAISGTTTFCAGDDSKLTASAGFQAYFWSTGQSTEAITVSAAGMYTVTVTDTKNCTGTTSVEIVVEEISKVMAGPDLNVIVLLEQYQHEITVVPAYHSSDDWKVDGFAKEPKHGQVTIEGKDLIRYAVNDKDYYGYDTFVYRVCPTGNCRDTCSTGRVFVMVQGSYNVIAPNCDCQDILFDPLDIYTHFDPPASKNNAEITIVNRWGEVVYHPDHYKAWNGNAHGDGTPLPQGTYYFRLRFKLDKEEIVQGAVNLLR